jgi:hypothetical protein
MTEADRRGPLHMRGLLVPMSPDAVGQLENRTDQLGRPADAPGANQIFWTAKCSPEEMKSLYREAREAGGYIWMSDIEMRLARDVLEESGLGVYYRDAPKKIGLNLDYLSYQDGQLIPASQCQGVFKRLGAGQDIGAHVDPDESELMVVVVRFMNFLRGAASNGGVVVY